MTRPKVVLAFLAALILAAPAEADDKFPKIDVCRQFSLIAKDVMIARQGKKPMSETLPRARSRIEVWVKKYGLELGSDWVKEAADVVVLPAYDEFVWPNGSLYDEKRQDAIDEYENLHFRECYSGLELDEY
jgi:hypothetical protein